MGIILRKVYLTFLTIYELPEIIYDKSKITKNSLSILSNPSELSKWYSAMYLYTYLDHYSKKIEKNCNKINNYEYIFDYFEKIPDIVETLYEEDKCLIPLLKQYILKKYYLFIPNIGKLTLGKILPIKTIYRNVGIDGRIYRDIYNKFLPGPIKLHIKIKNYKKQININLKIFPKYRIGRDFAPITIKSSNKLKIIKKSLLTNINKKTVSDLDAKASFFVRIYPVGAITIHLNLYVGSKRGITVDDIINIQRQGYHSIQLIYKNKKYYINDFLIYILNNILNSILYGSRTNTHRHFYKHTIIDIIDSKPKHIYKEKYYRELYGLIEATKDYYQLNDEIIVKNLIHKVTTGSWTIITSPKTTLIIYHRHIYKKRRRRLRIKARDLIEIEHVRKLAAKQAIEHLNKLNNNLLNNYKTIGSELKHYFMFKSKDVDPILTAKIILKNPIMHEGLIRGLQKRVENSIKMNEIIDNLEKELNWTLYILSTNEPKIKNIIDIIINHLL